MLSDNELMRVQEVSSRLVKPVRLVLFGTGNQSLFERRIFDVARQVSGVSMNRISMEETSDPVMVGKPSMTITNGEQGRIHYLTSPEGAELAPFLEAIEWLGTDERLQNDSMSLGLDELTYPIDLMVLIASSCPHCPHTVRSAVTLAVRSELVSVTVVDALESDDLADRYKCKSTPTTIVNGGLTIVGNIGADELAKRLVESVADSSLTSIVDSMVKSGRAEDAAKLVCRKGRPEALAQVFKQKEFSTRIGALVAMEYALDINPQILDEVIDDLSSFLFSDDTGLKGDTAELLGKIGNVQAIPHLRRALNDQDEDVQEAVQEALDILEAKLQ